MLGHFHRLVSPMFEPFFLCRPVAGVLAALAAAASFAAEPAPAVNAPLHDTHWKLQALDGAAASAPGRRAELTLHTSPQHLSGFGGCNRLTGRYTQRGTELAVSALGSTRMACSAAKMQQEQSLIQALGEIDAYRIEGPVLSLMQGDKVRITFQKTSAK